MRRITKKWLSGCLGTSLVLCVQAYAFEHDGPARTQVIVRSLDFIEHMRALNERVVWNDICAVEKSHSYADERREARQKEVSRALDRYAGQPADAGSDIQERQDERLLPPGDMTAGAAPVTSSGRETPSKTPAVEPGHPFEDFSLRNPLNRIEWGTDFYFVSYREPDFMKDKGFLAGIFASYEHRTSRNEHIRTLKDAYESGEAVNLYRVEGRFSYGYVDYQNSGKMDGIRNYTFEIRGLVGYDMAVFQGARLTPYFGVGFRYLNDDSGGMTTSTGAYGYERESRYYYMPFGLEFSKELNSLWKFGLTLEYDLFIYGQQKSHLEDVDPIYSALSNDQNEGYGLRSSFRLSRQVPGAEFFIEPFVRYWYIGDSETSDIIYGPYIIGYGLEPKNNTTEYGCRIGARF